MKASQKGLLRMELYDFDYWSLNDFLGHVEIKRDMLLQLTEEANSNPVRLDFTLREFHGFLYVKYGILEDRFRIKVVRAESLEIVDPFGLADPFVEVYFGDTLIGINRILYLHTIVCLVFNY